MAAGAIPRRRRIRPVTPSRGNERRQPDSDRAAYRRRDRVEYSINHLKQFRRVAARHEKRGANHLGMVTVGTILPWL